MSIYLKKNDRLPVLRATLLGPTGAAVDLSTASSVRFRMRRRGASVLKVDALATVVDAAAGIVQYQWASGDTDTEGQYDCEFVVTIGGLVETVPSSGYVLATIDASLA